VQFYQHWSGSKNQSQILNEAVLENATAWELVFICLLLETLVV
jgi:hypothetical protein